MHSTNCKLMNVVQETSGERTLGTRKLSALNAKYRHMSGEFNYKGHHWVRWTSPQLIQAVEERFEFLPTDIIIAGYAKSGNTLLSEIVRLVVMCQGDRNNITKALEVADHLPVHHQVIFLEEDCALMYPPFKHKIYPLEYLEWLKQRQSMRLIKTHLPLNSIECALNRMNERLQPLILYVYRNPKDVAVSMYHFYRGIVECGPFEGDWNEFFDMWLDGWISGGDWRTVVPEWLRGTKHTTNSKEFAPHVVSFENMVTDSRRVIESLHLLIYPRKKLDQEVVELIHKRTLFENMRTNPMTNYDGVEGLDPRFNFMRKGQVGDWKNWFTSEQNERFDQVYAKTIAEVNELLTPAQLIFE